MAGPLAEVADVEAIWRTLEPTETTQANALIDIASAKLRSALPAVDARIALYGTLPVNPLALDPVVVANVVATIVKRVLVNPDGLASTTQTFGPISEARNYEGRSGGDDSDSRGEIRVTAADLDNLLPVLATRRGGLRSIQVGLEASMQPPLGYQTTYPGLYPNGWAGDGL